MTNGEKIQHDFKCEVCDPIIEDNIIHVIFADKSDSAIGFDWDWWNAEYKKSTTPNDCENCIHNKGVLECDMYGCKYEPTTKKNLVVDVLEEIREEINEIEIPEDYRQGDECFAFCDALKLVEGILDKKSTPTITLEGLKEIREEIDKIEIPEDYRQGDECFAFHDALMLVKGILDKKISYMENGLLPCPFCGAIPKVFGRKHREYFDGEWAEKGREEYWIKPFCYPVCFLGNIHSKAYGVVDEMKFKTKEAAIENWNRRVKISEFEGVE